MDSILFFMVLSYLSTILLVPCHTPLPPFAQPKTFSQRSHIMNILDKVAKYSQHTPSFHYVKRRFFPTTPLVFDHIAHRSFNYNSILSYYTSMQFQQQTDNYWFPHMGVHAIWLKHPSFCVFLSRYERPVFYSIKSYEDYQQIRKQNDYVAWTLLHKDDINHIAIRVPNLDEMVEKIKEDGYLRLNNDNHPIEESMDGKLRQASTVADKIMYTFPNGDKHEVPCSFVEFVERREGREGFETKNAARIFTSTNVQ